MPTFAVVFVSDTSLKIGSPSGNVLETLTRDETPLTEIVAERALPVAGGVGASCVGGFAASSGGLGREAGGAVGAVDVSDTCGANGSLLVKRSKVTSCP